MNLKTNMTLQLFTWRSVVIITSLLSLFTLLFGFNIHDAHTLHKSILKINRSTPEGTLAGENNTVSRYQIRTVFLANKLLRCPEGPKQLSCCRPYSCLFERFKKLSLFFILSVILVCFLNVNLNEGHQFFGHIMKLFLSLR